MKKSVLMLLTAATLIAAIPAQAATVQGEQRQVARDVKQGTRQVSRDIKQDCREGVVGNADCRQDHRENKQDGRDKARDIKY
ncbi:MAG TPA: hypothetical protein VJY99_15630 [Buttiauxella sp.]|uniref:hypothetical protein n=1 Tax=Buttiauxella sp. TaxID=1972222 RepID=UPI002B4A622E|nr:hypothetical protein [Buttiauxella sp.]HKM98107.1 hypothetical protein [Buttiauxella sp.]